MKTLYYGATRYDAADIDFDDQYIYDVILGKTNKLQVKKEQIEQEECLAPFKEWSKKVDKVGY
jgi:guanine deaminase